MQKTDILGRPDLVRLVDEFYSRVRAHAALGPVFDDVAKVNWSEHLPKLYDFWDTMLFRAGSFRGDPLGAHLKLVGTAGMDWPLFEGWLELFRKTVGDLFEGDNAVHLVRCAEDMARAIHSKIHALPNPRFDPSKLSAEQRERYSRYRAS